MDCSKYYQTITQFIIFLYTKKFFVDILLFALLFGRNLIYY